jgi:hypothetical protein
MTPRAYLDVIEKKMIPGHGRNLVQPVTRNVRYTDSYPGSNSTGQKASAYRSNIKLTIL